VDLFEEEQIICSMLYAWICDHLEGCKIKFHMN
jgi:hypothetical protein